MRNEAPSRGFPSSWRIIKDERNPKDPFIIGPRTHFVIENGAMDSIVAIREGTRVDIRRGAKNCIFVVEKDVEISGNNGCRVIEVKSIKDELMGMIDQLKAEIEAAMENVIVLDNGQKPAV
ncbi:MAG: hypothetical protein WC269_00635 [Candidatus Gracilibacteria bacterium]|jgi:hypothetical protein